jgi:hypothetical protein
MQNHSAAKLPGTIDLLSPFIFQEGNMLEVFWFIILSLLAALPSAWLGGWQRIEPVPDEGFYIYPCIAGIGALVIQVVAFAVLGLHWLPDAIRWLYDALPEHGTLINQMTGAFLVVVGILGATAVTLWPSYVYGGAMFKRWLDRPDQRDMHAA